MAGFKNKENVRRPLATQNSPGEQSQGSLHPQNERDPCEEHGVPDCDQTRIEHQKDAEAHKPDSSRAQPETDLPVVVKHVGLVVCEGL